ncbi:hypothetical protein A3K34_02490 [candidate division WWE3 bacterium RIFOXYC1_FULL_40_10]|uniref:Aspartyl/glutamyl-tRNA(Asn/Gln) amidotransferase subunit C n=1 Tax=candidate division WWE3 bacterium RIFOXYA2_FULL_46_9 TaxID=1802636 RepID=A0A1F4W3U9_UNCKA|nr:MAG: hypothetical protein A3K58_02490 [candidate division WWE3 bacterium RIFOXYB1_FULL_40_22]OGC61719.1 MAG: hypothetical protein A3K37_02490 [candidate division WWE3 bacterium RIFOXYA1_FULL_40_11]OGC63703.1 MAG: hypothetical protein A2264_04980 [candidate division WWE3 bacterium RIFOXYA2_FULL_46_9]OGC64893.1 MAG: hypothetical protein A2326_01315 [candidate division WWE3 bacterium RIFOXYB2_FULL_41_6]OGC66102.1 MAG: hypothetical protein A3K34_02490 [candidate division WWE3 bacterium RIFOXYC1_
MVDRISKDEVLHIAKLIKVDVSGQEEAFSEILTDTLDYVVTLNELDTHNIDETYQVTGRKNVFQKENVSATLSAEEALSNASKRVGDLFGAEAVFDR